MSQVCEKCGATDNLEEHHISYFPEATQILCGKCHGLTRKGHRERCPVCFAPFYVLYIRYTSGKQKTFPVGKYCGSCGHFEITHKAPIDGLESK